MKRGILLSALFLACALRGKAEEGGLNRGQAALLLWERAGGVSYDITAHPFTDLSGTDDGVIQAVAWAWNAGVSQGVGENTFAPDRPLTRAEWATLLRRSGPELGLDTFLSDGAAACNDFEGVTDWGGDDLYWACITGHLPWGEGGRLDPSGLVSETEARVGMDAGQQG